MATRRTKPEPVKFPFNGSDAENLVAARRMAKAGLKKKAYKSKSVLPKALVSAVLNASYPTKRDYLDAYSNEPIEVHRISRTHVSMDRPSISVLWMCQPHRLDEFLAQPHLLESGLLARFLVMHSGGSMPSLTGKEPKVPQVVKAAYEGVVEELFMQYFQNDVRSQKVRSPEKAQALMREFHNHVEARANTDRQDITACICRWPEQAWRLALVLHAATYGKDSHKHQLAVGTAANAIKLTQWFGDQQIKILNATGSQRQTQRMRKLLRNLQNSPEGELTFRDLRNSHGFSSEEVEELVAAFPDRFRVEVIQNPNGGPKSHLLCLP